jgi:hypothetical protein
MTRGACPLVSAPQVLAVALGGSCIGLSLFLVSRPGRALLRRLLPCCGRRCRQQDVAAGAQPPRSPDALPSPFGAPASGGGGSRCANAPAAEGGAGGEQGAGGIVRGFIEFLYVGDFEVTRDVGSDAALYLRFQRMVRRARHCRRGPPHAQARR